MRARGVQFRNLPELVGREQWRGPIPFLYCDECGGEFSANRGDYFMQNPLDVARCCGEPMRLMVKRTQILRWRPAAKGTSHA